ncbi:TetR/AcrR family transcriptional regulator [Amycolatopsis minnesotensis]|uniref:TetR/AcrR family transcriptional regulator n=1 Tax=Amycolatopsis minnesotensis TaxID=337894 RepID=A0ABN2SS16_9PSEU
MTRRTDTRQRMLRTAAELFHTQGYHATGLNQLVAEGGAPKGSLYFHFPGGKEQLAAEALRSSSEQFAEAIAVLLRDSRTAAEAVSTLAEYLAESLEKSGFRRGCPLATVALDAADDSELIRVACGDGYRHWQEILIGYLTGQGASRERATELSVVVLASIEGALLFAKTLRDVSPLRTVAAHFRTTLEKELS